MSLMQSMVLGSILTVGSLTCAAQTGHLLGTVVDKAEQVPIRYGFVLIYGAGSVGARTAKVDEKGRFSLPLPDGTYDILIGAAGFAPACKRVVVTAGKSARFDARLGPDEASLEQ